MSEQESTDQGESRDEPTARSSSRPLRREAERIPEVIRAMLECIGLPAKPPPSSPSRGHEQPGFDFGAD
jgi:hypothetical protein